MNSDDIAIDRSLIQTEEEILARWGFFEKPLVSIHCAAYNHEKYIRDALDGFLIQQTDFPFEVLIHDDASTDGTADIIREYEQRYPNIFKPIYQKVNQYSRGIKSIGINVKRAKGSYLAWCEGDDYWISPSKLQRQLDLLRNYPEAIMSVSRTLLCRQTDDTLTYLDTTSCPKNILLDFDDIESIYFHTSTYITRILDYIKVRDEYFLNNLISGDTALRAVMISKAPFVFLDDIVSVYRITGEGTWSSLDREKQIEWELHTARNLAVMLEGRYSIHQYAKSYHLAMSLLLLKIKSGKFFEGTKLFPYIIRFGIKLLPYYVNVIFRDKFSLNKKVYKKR